MNPFFRLSNLAATNEKPPGWNRGATVTSTKRQLGPTHETELATPFSHRSGRRTSGAVILSYPSIFAIQAAVAVRFGVSTIDLQRRGSGGARPRQLAYWLCRHCTLSSLPEIGRAFGGRDHTTVIHGIRRVNELLCSDPEFAWAAVQLRYQFTPREQVA